MAKRTSHHKARVIKHKVADGIYLLRFESRYQLTSTFLRVQEHYESPRFHGRIFTLEQFMDWYAAENGAFTYFEDWSGFNVPSTAFRAFYEGKFDPLTVKEKRLLGLFRNLRGRFYVIGIYDGGKQGTLTHEIAHALFFIDEGYRAAVREAMRGYDTSALERQLVKAGYAEHVIPDEVQAYIVAPSDELGRISPALNPLRRKLRALFRRHAHGFSVPAIR